MLALGLLLAAAAPPPACPAPEARQFDFWIGDWDIVNRYRTAAGWTVAGTATNHVFAVAGGCAVVELWDGHLGSNHIRGFSVRAWDPARERWMLVLNWPQPGSARFGTLEGTFRHGRGDFFVERQTDEGAVVQTRYTFADITDSTFRWNDGTSRDTGRTWETRWIMEFTRRAPHASPLFNLVTADPGRTRLCTREQDRAFDDLLGTWRAPDGRAQRRSYAIVAGCAVMDFLRWTDATGRAQEAFLVRAFDGQQWVQYAVGPEDGTLMRATGSPERLATDDGDTQRWTRDGEDRLRLRWERKGTVQEFVLDRVP